MTIPALHTLLMQFNIHNGVPYIDQIKHLYNPFEPEWVSHITLEAKPWEEVIEILKGDI